MDIIKGQLNPKYKVIPTQLAEKQFNEFVLPHLSVGRSGPRSPTPLYRIFHYILSVLYTGMQWKQIPIQLKENGKPEIHYTRVFKIYKRWVNDGSLEKLFNSSVLRLKENNLLDLSILHGDGSSTPAKKGGDNIGYNGHKHFKGEKVIAVVDRHVNVITPYTQAAGNKNESPLFSSA